MQTSGQEGLGTSRRWLRKQDPHESQSALIETTSYGVSRIPTGPLQYVGMGVNQAGLNISLGGEVRSGLGEECGEASAKSGLDIRFPWTTGVPLVLIFGPCGAFLILCEHLSPMAEGDRNEEDV